MKDDEATSYLLKVYEKEYALAMERGVPFVEVSVGNFPRFLHALRIATAIASQVPMPDSDRLICALDDLLKLVERNPEICPACTEITSARNALKAAIQATQHDVADRIDHWLRTGEIK